MSQSFQKQIKSAYAKQYAKENIEYQKRYFLSQLNSLYANKMLEIYSLFYGFLMLATLGFAILAAKLYV
jgi:hypothetical protein